MFLAAPPQAAEFRLMMLSTKCPRCHEKIEFVDAQTGSSTFCPRCNKEIDLKAGKAMWLKLLLWSWLVIIVLGGGGYAAYHMFPGVKKTAQGIWRGIVSLFDPVGASRGR